MHTRGRAKVQSLSNPVNPLDTSRASEEESNLGVASMLSEGAVSNVGEIAPV